MNLQDKWISSFVNQNDALKEIREKSFSFLKENGFPTPKDEAWRFTPLASVLDKNYTLKPQPAKVSSEEIRPFFVQEDSHKIVFVNGFFSEELSNISAENFSFSLLSQIVENEGNGNFLQNYFNKETRKNDVFTALNTAFFSDGFYINVEKNKVVEKPIEVLYITSAESPTWVQPRNVLILSDNAQAKVIESHYSLSSEPNLTNAITEIFVAKDAVLDYYKTQNDRLESSLIDNTYISQEKGSNASVHTFSFGGNLTRNNLNFYHKGEHLESTLKGISILDGTQCVDNYTLVNHAEPNCESHQDYKAILSGNSAGVFNGKIMVEKIAQKTNAYQQNDTILLSEKATMNTKPQLEIFADDVKCSHGCTIGELNKEALFYLKTRGMAQKKAEALLTLAFANTVLESVKIDALHDYLEEIIAKKLKV